jgi:hypothetical protein
MPTDQPASPLLSLPPELRNIIYVYVFSGHRIEPVLYDNEKPDEVNVYTCETKLQETRHSTIQDFHLLVALTQTCRQIRAEARLLPWKLNKYTVSRSAHFVKWLDLLEDAVRLIVWKNLSERQLNAVSMRRDILRALKLRTNKRGA